MSNKLKCGGLTSGTTYVLVITNSVGQYWNGAAYEAYDAANIATYVASASTANSAGDWFGSVPAQSADDLDFTLRSRAGGSLALSDATVASGSVSWDGTGIANSRNAFIAPHGLDAIAIPTLTAKATTFPQMIVQTWRRFFAKTVYDSIGGTMKTYADDGTTAVTTQATADAGGSQSVGAA